MLRALIIIVAAGASTAIYAIFLERNWFAVRRHVVPCLPAGTEPISVLHVSDLHLRRGQRRKHRFLRSLARLSPDLVVGTGDFLGDPSSVEATATALELPARRGALFVLGSNDYYAPKWKSPLGYLRKRKRRVPGVPNPWWELVGALEARGWTLLNNRSARIGDIDVVGLDDAHIGRADLSVATDRSDGEFRLAVAHSPDGAEVLAARGYDLIVCGHTHGGQIRIPGFGALVTNSTLPRRMARGLHRLNGSWLHVSAGLGTSMYAPFRFACRPEVCLLELVPAR